MYCTVAFKPLYKHVSCSVPWFSNNYPVMTVYVILPRIGGLLYLLIAKISCFTMTHMVLLFCLCCLLQFLCIHGKVIVPGSYTYNEIYVYLHGH